MRNIDPYKFFIPFLLILFTIVFSLIDKESFLLRVLNANEWILTHFDWLFSWSGLFFLFILMVAYLSPLGKIKIGGETAIPLLTKWRWFSITICATIATGILFWGTAEPLFHNYEPPIGLDLVPGSVDAQRFAMSTMFMHWTFTPYGIYTITALLFALVYYNYRQPFSLGALLYPLIGKNAYGYIGNTVDIICLYSLVAGMSAALGAGILTISGGLHTVVGISESQWLLAVICIAIVLTFVISASTGLLKGIRILSGFNIIGFFLIAAFILIFGPFTQIVSLGVQGLVDYLVHFIPRSANIGSSINEPWLHTWTIFYWANWMAWAPVAALFLGRISVGYSVRAFIRFNLIYPSLFGVVWMVIFSGTSLITDEHSDTQFLYSILKTEGEQNVIFSIFSTLPYGQVLGLLFISLAFLSFVTAADSNTLAMSGISSKNLSRENPTAPVVLKISWGIIIGLLAWIMVAYTGADGIRMLSILGGFPALFLIIGASLSLSKIILKSF